MTSVWQKVREIVGSCLPFMPASGSFAAGPFVAESRFGHHALSFRRRWHTEGGKWTAVSFYPKGRRNADKLTALSVHQNGVIQTLWPEGIREVPPHPPQKYPALHFHWTEGGPGGKEKGALTFIKMDEGGNKTITYERIAPKTWMVGWRLGGGTPTVSFSDLVLTLNIPIPEAIDYDARAKSIVRAAELEEFAEACLKASR